MPTTITWWQIFLTTLLLAACRRAAPPTPPPQAAQAPTQMAVSRDGTFLYTHATADGRFETTDDPEKVPPVARATVRVVDPTATAGTSPAPDHVYVLDVTALLDAGKATARLVPRPLFETRALALLPPGASSVLAEGPGDGGMPSELAGAPDGEARGDEGAGAGSGPTGSPSVIVYGTSWCPACRSARSYFIQNKIPFVDKDVEKDPAAAEELARKAAAAGVPADRIPILDVRGRLLIGFDKTRVEALLGERSI